MWYRTALRCDGFFVAVRRESYFYLSSIQMVWLSFMPCDRSSWMCPCQQSHIVTLLLVKIPRSWQHISCPRVGRIALLRILPISPKAPDWKCLVKDTILQDDKRSWKGSQLRTCSHLFTDYLCYGEVLFRSIQYVILYHNLVVLLTCAIVKFRNSLLNCPPVFLLWSQAKGCKVLTLKSCKLKSASVCGKATHMSV